MEELNFVHGSNSVASDQNLVNGLQVNHEPTNKLLLPANLDRPSDSGTSSEGDTVDSSDCNLPVLKYISDILLEEDLEGKPCMLEDILGLQAAEKSFYDALNQKDPPLPNQPSFSVHQSFENSDGGFQSSNGSIAAKTGSVWDFSETSHVQTSPVESLSDTTLVSDSFSDTQSLGNFRGVGEGNEIIDLEGYQCTPPGPNTLYVRAGFKQLPLDRELFKKVKTMSKMMGYHKDFGIEDDGEWMLQGWKGRIILALSALKPA
ncbi:hypothetical protein GBA52_021240 [Prunus armeniaca]|nr:hypothetical protein GBA52_021240 [Prunus armeniaca]